MAGLQEPWAGQLQAILTAARGRYAAFPDPAEGDLAVESPLLWDTRRYEATRKTVIRTQFIRRVMPRPVVRLRDKATGRQFWVMNIHNAPWDYQEKRNRATAAQIAKIQELEESGLPVFYVGDFNEKKTIDRGDPRRHGCGEPGQGPEGPARRGAQALTSRPTADRPLT